LITVIIDDSIEKDENDPIKPVVVEDEPEDILTQGDIKVVKKPARLDPELDKLFKPVISDGLSKHEIECYVDQETNKYGLQDLTASKILIEPIYDEIRNLREIMRFPYVSAC
jgi:hypothetical protein